MPGAKCAANTKGKPSLRRVQRQTNWYPKSTPAPWFHWQPWRARYRLTSHPENGSPPRRPEESHHLFSNAEPAPGRSPYQCPTRGQSQIDTVRIISGQGAVLLGNHKRRVVGQNDATRANFQPFGGGQYLTDDHRVRSTRDGWDIMVLANQKRWYPRFSACRASVTLSRKASTALAPSVMADRSSIKNLSTFIFLF